MIRGHKIYLPARQLSLYRAMLLKFVSSNADTGHASGEAVRAAVGGVRGFCGGYCENPDNELLTLLSRIACLRRNPVRVSSTSSSLTLFLDLMERRKKNRHKPGLHQTVGSRLACP